MITVITPTADQPIGIALLEKYVARQTVKPDQWIVADDGVETAKLTLGQDHIVRQRTLEGGKSLALNISSALNKVQGDYIVIMEHDDWYSADHIETVVKHEVYGAAYTRYYNVKTNGYARFRNRGASLCCTGFHKKHIDKMRKAAQWCLSTGSISLDIAFWRQVKANTQNGSTFVGIKGLPGREGLGIGHRAKGWPIDTDRSVLREWIGADADNY